MRTRMFGTWTAGGAVRLLFLGVYFLALTGVLRAQTSTNATNSTVRFRIAHGSTLLGDIDVELFDQQKPVTVSNFLFYAQSGRYADSILHGVIPGFVVEGGGFTIPTPFADSPMLVANAVVAGDPITNEFSVGGVQNNVLGTLAMSKGPGQPNGAASRWFFNLADNTRGGGATNLNTSNGGYTVFGRVTAGLSVLTQFNGRQVGNGIADTTSERYRAVCAGLLPFTALPVSFFGGLGCVNYTDVYTVEIILLNAPDVVRPTVAVVSPAANARFTASDLTVRGWVADNRGVASVRVRQGTNESVTATVTGTNWTVVLPNLPPGTNSIVAEAIDTSGLRGQSMISVFRSVRAPLTLGMVGHGRVQGATNQQLLEIGYGYQLTAVPDRGNLFSGWTGDFVRETAVLKFLMASNLALTANFATNLFPGVKGTYTGLFYDPGQVDPRAAGYFTLTLAAAGSYSAKLQMNGRTHALKGTFAPDGRETNVVSRPGTNSLRVEMAVDLEGGSDQLTGSVTNNQGMAVDTNAAWSAVLLADRAVFKAPTNTAAQAGRYTLVIPPDETSVGGPPAEGFGAVNIQPTGRLSFAGVLPDGSRMAQGAVMSKGGAWPLYVTSGRDSAVVISWLAVTNTGLTNVSGRLHWFKPARRGARYYADGFTNESMVVGSGFQPGTPVSRVFGPVNAVVGFTHGNLPADFSHRVTFDANGKATNLETNALILTISKSTGLFKGSVKPPGARKATPFSGAILQRLDVGAGYFFGTNAAGRVVVGE